MPWQLLLVALLVPAALAGWFSAHALALVVLAGVVIVMLARLHKRVGDLEREVGEVRRQKAAAAGAPTPAMQPSPPAQPAPTPEPVREPVATAHDAADTVPIGEPAYETVPLGVTYSDAVPGFEVDERSTRVTSSIGESVAAWFRGGNTIVRLGVVILFIGVAFLLRFAAEHAVLPIELRLAGVAAGGVALSALGWRLRGSRRGYGLSLQGAGIGVLYLVIFAALRLYAVLPAPLAFALLAALSLLAALFALRQDALPLAVLAFGGGFLAPVVASTGQGNHVALFGYYLVLNAAIAWIASRQAWKLLNLVGFAFTFVIGTAWGLKAYRPEIYASTQLFLLLHFALYLYVCVAYSRQLVAAKDEARLRYVDGGLLFGLPIVAFGLQAGIVRHLPYGLALSSAALSAVYLLLGRWLWHRAGPALRLLTEGMLALGLVFLALVTPLALDARWTGAAWSVQGAGLLWIALRQQRGWAAALGIVLQVAAAAAFWSHGRESALPLWLNGHLLGALLLGASALVSARLLHGRAAALPWPDAPRPLPAAAIAPAHWAMLVLGVAQTLLGLWSEARLAAAPFDEAWRACLLLAAGAVAMERAQRLLRWPELGVPARALVALALLVSIEQVLDAAGVDAMFRRFFAGGGWIEALALLGVGVWQQSRLAQDAAPWRRSHPVEHLLLGWYAMLQGGLQAYALAGHGVARHEAWTPAALIVLPTLFAWWIATRLRSARWPASAHEVAWRAGLLLPWLALLGAWSLAVDALADGGMRPLQYLPLVNPVDLGHALGALYVVALVRARLVPTRPLAIGLAATGFVWLDGVLVRTLHHWAGTPMWTDGALANGVVQTGLTILWTTLALGAMLYAARRAAPAIARGVWLVGAGLLGVVVAKLFFVDLSSIGALERIVSFLGVGALMLVIGYVSPLPPSASAGARP